MLMGVQRVLVGAFTERDPTPPNKDPKPVTIIQFADDGTRLATASLPRVIKTEDEWKKQLSPLSYDVTRRAGYGVCLQRRLDNNIRQACTAASTATTRCSTPARSSIPARAGRASGSPSPKKMSTKRWI